MIVKRFVSSGARWTSFACVASEPHDDESGRLGYQDRSTRRNDRNDLTFPCIPYGRVLFFAYSSVPSTRQAFYKNWTIRSHETGS